MKKILATFALFIFFIALFFSFRETAKAAFIKVGGEGSLLWQVLGEEDEDDSSDSLESDETELRVRTTNKGEGVELRLKTEEGKTSLRIAGPSGETEMDVSEIEGDLVEIEERPGDSNIKVRLRGDKFEIRQKGVGALTNFPLSINTDTNELTVTTPSGSRVVSVLPSVAVERILSSNILDRIVSPEEEVEEEGVPGDLVELSEEGERLVFRVRGEKDLRFLNLFPLTVPIEVGVSAQTGEVISIKQPFFLRFLSFLFT